MKQKNRTGSSIRINMDELRRIELKRIQDRLAVRIDWYEQAIISVDTELFTCELASFEPGIQSNPISRVSHEIQLYKLERTLSSYKHRLRNLHFAWHVYTPGQQLDSDTEGLVYV
jgi:hypothetical protein